MSQANTVDQGLIEKLMAAVGNASATSGSSKPVVGSPPVAGNGTGGAGAGSNDTTALLEKLLQRNSELESKVRELSEVEADARLMVTDGADPERAKKAVFNLLRRNGASEASAKAYVEQMEFGDGGDGGADPQPQQQQRQAGRAKQAEPSELDALKAQIANLEKQLKGESATRKRGYFDNVLQDAFKNDTSVQEILKASKNLRGEDKTAEALKTIFDDVKERALNDLQNRSIRAGGRPPTEQEIQEAATAAIQRSTGVIRQTFGNLNDLGRVPDPAETFEFTPSVNGPDGKPITAESVTPDFEGDLPQARSELFKQGLLKMAQQTQAQQTDSLA